MVLLSNFKKSKRIKEESKMLTPHNTKVHTGFRKTTGNNNVTSKLV